MPKEKEVKDEIKFIKFSVQEGILEAKINGPQKNNGCVLTIMNLPMLLRLKTLVDAEIKRKKLKAQEEEK